MGFLRRFRFQFSSMQGVRDLRSPRSVVVMEPKSAFHFVSTSATIRFALLCPLAARSMFDAMMYQGY